ncbi:MAG: lipocalin family protein [Chitinophagales bacterium]|nr:lipocalin family protein [Chitinophagales bacterium]
MKKIHHFLPVLLILSAFCKKETPQQVESILIDGTWIQYEYLTDDNADGIFTDASLPCQLYDGWKFNADHTFELRDEIEYCDSDVDSVVVIPGTWELRNNDTELYVEVDPDFLVFNFQIHSINDSLLVLRQFNTPASQAPLEERFVLRR